MIKFICHIFQQNLVLIFYNLNKNLHIFNSIKFYTCNNLNQELYDNLKLLFQVM